MVTGEDNNFLMNIPTRNEVKNVVFSINVDDAPGPDGFGGGFFQKFWDIVVDMSSRGWFNSLTVVISFPTGIPILLS